ncbi:hypothetical protein JW766_02860 [Candidatus Dojkabacteria bacterium]|nr:hypothetical protein [Candidatus Dojkabacteria bacterium]
MSKRRIGYIFILVGVLVAVFSGVVVLSLTLKEKEEYKEIEEIEEEEGFEEESPEEIVREAFGGVYPLSGEIIEIDVGEKWIMVKVDDEEKRFDISDNFKCEQIGMPGQVCESMEGTGCDLEPLTCRLSSVEIENSLGVDLEIDSDNEAVFLRVHYIAH